LIAAVYYGIGKVSLPQPKTRQSRENATM
jgi:hypothetical protein